MDKTAKNERNDQLGILRVFLRRTSQTPQDELVQIGEPELFTSNPSEIDEVHISVIFSWDKEKALKLKKFYERSYAVVKIGGPAFPDTVRDKSEFCTGRYIKQGIIFTTRGCDFSCPWCLVPEIEGKFRQISEVSSGNTIQDNNILLSNRDHFLKVCQMLRGETGIRFLGGLDSRLLKDWHIEELRSLRIKEIWLSFDW